MPCYPRVFCTFSTSLCMETTIFRTQCVRVFPHDNDFFWKYVMQREARFALQLFVQYTLLYCTTGMVWGSNRYTGSCTKGTLSREGCCSSNQKKIFFVRNTRHPFLSSLYQYCNPPLPPLRPHSPQSCSHNLTLCFLPSSLPPFHPPFF